MTERAAFVHGRSTLSPFLPRQPPLSDAREGAHGPRMTLQGSRAPPRRGSGSMPLSRAPQQVLKPDHRARDVEEREVIPRGLLEARSEGPESLEVMEEDLDTVALTVSTTVKARLVLATRVCVDDRFDLLRLQLVADGIRIVTGVGYERFSARVVLDDRRGDRRLVLLARRDLDVERPPFRVDEGVDLRGEPTSRMTQCIADDPPFPPAASWWARTTEASIMTPSSSSSNWRALKMAAQCPLRDQFENRLYTVFHAPNRSGRSRHGMPVLARYRTASMNVRSSSFGAGPGRDGARRRTIAHWASVSAWRYVTPSFDHADGRSSSVLRRSGRKGSK